MDISTMGVKKIHDHYYRHVFNEISQNSGNYSSLIYATACCRTGDKPSSGPMQNELRMDVLRDLNYLIQRELYHAPFRFRVSYPYCLIFAIQYWNVLLKFNDTIPTCQISKLQYILKQMAIDKSIGIKFSPLIKCQGSL